MTNPNPNKIPRLLITAGPTHEPIDAVRFLGNRSSGRVGSAIADEAARRGWPVRLLMGPAALLPESPEIDVVRFQSTSDLEALLAEHFPACDALIMAAAVSDFRPVVPRSARDGKWTRGKTRVTLELEPTPDLLAGCSARSRPDQLLVGFALEPRERLDESARGKLARKNVDLIVANPLETMDADSIEATLYARGGEVLGATDGAVSKTLFAAWLLDRIGRRLETGRRAVPTADANTDRSDRHGLPQ